MIVSPPSRTSCCPRGRRHTSSMVLRWNGAPGEGWDLAPVSTIARHHHHRVPPASTRGPTCGDRSATSRRRIAVWCCSISRRRWTGICSRTVPSPANESKVAAVRSCSVDLSGMPRVPQGRECGSICWPNAAVSTAWVWISRSGVPAAGSPGAARAPRPASSDFGPTGGRRWTSRQERPSRRHRWSPCQWTAGIRRTMASAAAAGLAAALASGCRAVHRCSDRRGWARPWPRRPCWRAPSRMCRRPRWACCGIATGSGSRDGFPGPVRSCRWRIRRFPL